MEYRYKTRGVCSSEILLELDGDVVKSAKFTGGCNGNLKGICSLIAGCHRTVQGHPVRL